MKGSLPSPDACSWLTGRGESLGDQRSPPTSLPVPIPRRSVATVAETTPKVLLCVHTERIYCTSLPVSKAPLHPPPRIHQIAFASSRELNHHQLHTAYAAAAPIHRTLSTRFIHLLKEKVNLHKCTCIDYANNPRSSLVSMNLHTNVLC